MKLFLYAAIKINPLKGHKKALFRIIKKRAKNLFRKSYESQKI